MAASAPPPPPHGFEDFSGSNGNSPPEPLIHLTTSTSDAAFPSHPNIERLNFLSAKNSVELHKQMIERKRSLPATFLPEDYERAFIRDDDGPSSHLTNLVGQSLRNNLIKKANCARKSVGWADLHGSSILQNLVCSNPPEAGTSELENFERDAPMDIDEYNQISSASPEPKTTGISENSLEEQQVSTQASIKDDQTLPALGHAVHSEHEILIQCFGAIGGPHELEPRHPNEELAGHLPESLFDISNGPTASIEMLALDNNQEMINSFDGLILDTVPRSVYGDNCYPLEPQNCLHSIIGTPPEQMHENLSTFPNMHTPPYREYSPRQTPINSVMQDRMNYADYYDDDDDYIEPDKTLVIPSARELNAPEPERVAQTCPPEYVPLIAHTWKKDCRTWLWKSKSQRKARLAQQRYEEEPDKSS